MSTGPHDYPEKRKSAKRKICPVCQKLCAARGLVTHLRMAHSTTIAEVMNGVPIPAEETLPQKASDLKMDAKEIEPTKEETPLVVTNPVEQESDVTEVVKKKRLVMMFDDNSYREIDFTDYAEVKEWLHHLQEVKERFERRITRYRENPILRVIERGL